MTVGLVCRLRIFVKLHLLRLLFCLAPALRFAMSKLAALVALAFELCLRFVFVGVGLGVFCCISVFVLFSFP